MLTKIKICGIISSLMKGECSVIITQDNEKNILFGELNVVEEKKEEFKAVRDYLMKHSNDLGHYQVVDKDLSGFCSLLNAGYTRVPNTDVLRYQEIKSKFGDECDYERIDYHSVYLNSILLFTSLLNDLNVSNYDEIAKQFICNGIYYTAPINEIWNDCSQKMTDLNSFLNRNKETYLGDLKAFRAAIKEGYIRYDIIEKISPQQQRGHAIFGAGDLQSLNQIEVNNTLIHGNNHYLKKQRKK